MTIRHIGKIVLWIWLFLTAIVIMFLIHRFRNPGWKSISDTDLIDYAKFSCLLLGVYVVTKLMSKDKKE